MRYQLAIHIGFAPHETASQYYFLSIIGAQPCVDVSFPLAPHPILTILQARIHSGGGL